MSDNISWKEIDRNTEAALARNPTNELVERLLAKEFSGQFAIGGGTIDSEGNSTSWGGEKIMRLRNPDGPEAAALITSQQRELDELRDLLGEANCVLQQFRGIQRGHGWDAEMNLLDETQNAISTALNATTHGEVR